MKKRKMVLFALGLGLARCSWAGARGSLDGVPSQTVKPAAVQARLSPSVTKIALKIDGGADIEFHSSEDVFSATNIRFEHSDKNPVSITVENNRAVLRQKGKRVHARYDVFIPKGRSVDISVGAANFKGEMNEKSLEFTVGAMNLKARLTVENTLEFTCGSANFDAEIFKVKKLKLSCGSAGGKLVVPKGARIPWTPFWFGLKIVKRGGNQ